MSEYPIGTLVCNIMLIIIYIIYTICDLGATCYLIDFHKTFHPKFFNLCIWLCIGRTAKIYQDPLNFNAKNNESYLGVRDIGQIRIEFWKNGTKSTKNATGSGHRNATLDCNILLEIIYIIYSIRDFGRQWLSNRLDNEFGCVLGANSNIYGDPLQQIKDLTSDANKGS